MTEAAGPYWIDYCHGMVGGRAKAAEERVKALEAENKALREN